MEGSSKSELLDCTIEYYEEFATLWNSRDKRRLKETFYPHDKLKSLESSRARSYWKSAMGFAFYCFTRRLSKKDDQTKREVIFLTKGTLHQSIILFHQFLVRSPWKKVHKLYGIFYLQCLFIVLACHFSGDADLELMNEYVLGYKKLKTPDHGKSTNEFTNCTFSIFNSMVKNTLEHRCNNRDPPDPKHKEFEFMLIAHVEKMNWKQLEFDVLMTLDYDLSYQSPTEWFDFYAHSSKEMKLIKRDLKKENLNWVIDPDDIEHKMEFNLIHLFVDVSMLSAGILSNNSLTQIIIGSIAMAKCFLSSPISEVKVLLQLSQLPMKDLISFLILFSKSLNKWNSSKRPFDRMQSYWEHKGKHIFHSKNESSPTTLSPRVCWILSEKIFLEYFEPEETNKHLKKLETNPTKTVEFFAWYDKEYVNHSTQKNLVRTQSLSQIQDDQETAVELKKPLVDVL